MDSSLLKQLEKVRQSGQVDLYSRSSVSATAEDMDLDELARYSKNCSLSDYMETLKTYSKWLKEAPEGHSIMISVKSLAAGGLTLTCRQTESTVSCFATTPVGQWGPFDTLEHAVTVAIKALCDRAVEIECERGL